MFKPRLYGLMKDSLTYTTMKPRQVSDWRARRPKYGTGNGNGCILTSYTATHNLSSVLSEGYPASQCPMSLDVRHHACDPHGPHFPH